MVCAWEDFFLLVICSFDYFCWCFCNGFGLFSPREDGGNFHGGANVSE